MFAIVPIVARYCKIHESFKSFTILTSKSLDENCETCAFALHVIVRVQGGGGVAPVQFLLHEYHACLVIDESFNAILQLHQERFTL